MVRHYKTPLVIREITYLDYVQNSAGSRGEPVQEYNTPV